MKYTDPDGRVIDASELDPGDYLVFEKAMASLESTKRGKELINRLSVSPRIFKIKTNRDAKNNYSPLTKTINWDPSKVLYTSDDSAINPEVLLAHEMGHAEQDLDNQIPEEFSFEQRLDIEHRNMKKTEIPISQELKQGQRKHYYDWRYYTNEKGLRLNSVYNCPLTLKNQRKLRNLNIQIYTSLLRVGGGISHTSK